MSDARPHPMHRPVGARPRAAAAGQPLLTPAPSASFDEPVDMLHACHDRTRQRADLLDRLAAHLAANGADHAAREAARDLLRFFDIAAVHHHEDEERHVLPALRAAGQGALADQLQADHDALRQAWAGLRADLSRLAEGRWADAGEPAAGHAEREGRWARFAEAYRAHVALEETAVFPAFARRLHDDPAARAAMGTDMARRRGAAPAA